MTERSRPWDGSVTGDATDAPYDAGTEWARIMRAATSGSEMSSDKGGVMMDAFGFTSYAATVPSAGVVRVGSGVGWVQGTWHENDSTVDASIPTPGSSTRVDRIVLRKSWATQTVRITRIAGTEGAGAPAMTQSFGTVWDVPLWLVSIATNGVITLVDVRYGVGSGHPHFTSPIVDSGDVTLAAGHPIVNAADQFVADFRPGNAPIPFAAVMLFRKQDGTLLWQVGSSVVSGTVHKFEIYDAVDAITPFSIAASGITSLIGLDVSGNAHIAGILGIGQAAEVGSALAVTGSVEFHGNVEIHNGGFNIDASGGMATIVDGINVGPPGTNGYAATGDLRFASNRAMCWRKGDNSGDIVLAVDSNDRFVFSGGIATSATVGSAGPAAAPPATPAEYWQINIGGANRKVALYNP